MGSQSYPPGHKADTGLVDAVACAEAAFNDALGAARRAGLCVPLTLITSGKPKNGGQEYRLTVGRVSRTTFMGGCQIKVDGGVKSPRLSGA